MTKKPQIFSFPSVTIAQYQALLVPQFLQGGSYGVTAMPATILMSGSLLIYYTILCFKFNLCVYWLHYNKKRSENMCRETLWSKPVTETPNRFIFNSKGK